jgi:putative aldouronate transport system substrate-binding protein
MAYDSPMATTIAVSRTSKHPAEAVKFINLINTDKELYNLICFGVEGTHYTIENNRLKPIENSGYAPNSDWKFGNQFNALLKEGQQDDDWEKTREINDMSVKAPFLGLILEKDEVLTELAQIAKALQEYVDALVNTGVEAPDVYWDKYIGAMKQAGIEKVASYYQKQIDAFIAEKNAR